MDLIKIAGSELLDQNIQSEINTGTLCEIYRGQLSKVFLDTGKVQLQFLWLAVRKVSGREFEKTSWRLVPLLPKRLKIIDFEYKKVRYCKGGLILGGHGETCTIFPTNDESNIEKPED